MKNVNRLKRVLSGLMAFALLVGLAGCGQGASTAGDVATEAQAVTLHLAGGDTGLPNPFRHAPRGPGMSKMQILYDSLLEKDEEGQIPWVAKEWTTNETGTVYQFHLQENVFWHDDKPLTAEDVVFTLSYYKDHPPIVNELWVGDAYIVTEAKVLDTYDFEVTFEAFDHNNLARIGSMRILPKHIWESVDDPATYDGEDATVGSGPYVLDVYDAQQGTYRFVAHDNYWGLKPAATAIEWVPVSDPVLAFENQEIDLINAPADVLPNYQDKPGYEVKRAHSLHSYRLMMNMEKVEALRDVT